MTVSYTLNKIQKPYKDWTGERNARVVGRLLPILYPDSCDSRHRIIDDSVDFSYKIFKSSYDSSYKHHFYDRRVYFYTLPTGSLLSEKYRGKSLIPQKWQEGKYFTDDQKNGLRVILTRDIGLGRKMATILADRPIAHFRRIEEFISGFVDSLWLADEKVFLSGSIERRLVKQTIRKIFKIGAFNVGLLVDYWKEFGNYVFHKLADTKLIGGAIALSPFNCFKRLLSLRFIKRVFEGYKDHRTMQDIAHLMSSRQMPYAGYKTELKARERFKEVLTSDYRPPEHLVKTFKKVAARIGRQCRKLRPGPIPEGALHISVTSSGEYSHSIEKGAQAKAAMDAFKRYLDVTPDEDFKEDTPFGEVVHKKGIPLWRTAFRDETLDTELSFLEEFSYIKGQPDRVAGLDEATGIQLMYAAWKDYCKENIPVVRAEVVHEQGNKARHVTVAPYWVGMLQAPLAHALIEALKWHPSCFSSFHRQDQGWEAAKQLVRADRPLGPTEYVLSSDLKDATNAQQWDLTKSMIEGFMIGYGLDFISPYCRMVLGLIGPRIVELHDDETILSNVGIMMGEPVAKPGLTLLNLCIEELSFLEHEKKVYLLDRVKPDPPRKWRCFHVGGDDHLARGPLPYLERITELHKLCGSHIDPGKHGYSRYCVKYTERILDLTNLQRQHPKDVDEDDYSHSVIVDTVKVRLLEQGLSTGLKKDNKNVAIGKARQLGNALSWLPKDERFYPPGKIDSIRELFIKRMGNLLPKENENPRAFANIHLPTVVGGYGLGTKEETAYWLALSPEPTRYLLAKVYSFRQFGLHQDVSPDLRVFQKLNHNTSVRGLESMTEYLEAKAVQEAQEPFRRSPQGFGFRKITYHGELLSYEPYANRPYATWSDIKTSFREPGDDGKKIADRAAIAGWIPQSEYINRCARGLTFQTLLRGIEKLKPFNTVPFVRTYARHVWTWYEREGGQNWDLSVLDELDNDTIVSLIEDLRGMWYVNINAASPVTFLSKSPDDPNVSIETVEKGPRLDLETRGLPNLQIKNKFIRVFH